jgi:hypothetical protein
MARKKAKEKEQVTSENGRHSGEKGSDWNDGEGARHSGEKGSDWNAATEGEEEVDGDDETADA